MLIDLTPNLEELNTRKEIAANHNFEYIPVTSPKRHIKTGVYIPVGYNLCPSEFTEIKGVSEFDLIKKTSEYIRPKMLYGAADNLVQIEKYYSEEITDTENKFVITISPVFQDKDEPNEGWRWHKWGGYIGELKPKCEYLNNEDFGPDFKNLLVFQIYKIN